MLKCMCINIVALPNKTIIKIYPDFSNKLVVFFPDTTFLKETIHHPLKQWCDEFLSPTYNLIMRFNSLSGAGAYYAQHYIRGNGTSPYAAGDGTATATFPQTAGNAAAAGTRLTEGDTPFDNVATAAQKKAFTKASGVKVAGGYVTNTINATNVFLTCIKQGKVTRAAIASCVATGKFSNFTGGTFSSDANGDIKGGAPIGAYSVQADGTIKYIGQA